MHGMTAMLIAGALGTLGLAMGPAAPDPQAEIKACHDRCDASASETDRETCKLNCSHAVKHKDEPHITRWKEERSVGGTVPGQDAPPPPKRTVTTVTPRGTTTQTTQGPSTGPSPSPAPASATRNTTVLPSPRHRYYFGLVDCQDRCNSHKIGVDRARCKLRCFRRHPGPPPPPTVSAPPVRPTETPAATTPPARGSTPAPKPKAVTTPSAPTVDCAAQCASEGSEDDRLTCETNCRNAARHETQPTTKIERTTVTTRPADCRRQCQAKATSCRSSCEGDGSDASTCTLQCDQSARSCERRCG